MYCVVTLKCLSIGTPNTTTFPFVPNGKSFFYVSKYLSTLLLDWNVPKLWDTYKKLIFHLEQMENLLLLGVPILKHIAVVHLLTPQRGSRNIRKKMHAAWPVKNG